MKLAGAGWKGLGGGELETYLQVSWERGGVSQSGPADIVNGSCPGDWGYWYGDDSRI